MKLFCLTASIKYIYVVQIIICHFVQVWAGIPVNSVVISMFAKDLDAGENGTVKFSMTGKLILEDSLF